MARITPQQALSMCVEHREIPHEDMLALFSEIMSGNMSPVMIAALTMALRVKRETVGEIAAAAKIMRQYALKVPVNHPEALVDIVGTGGDGAHTFNISTAAMFVAAAAGAKVAKHGGRSVSSSSGSADLLEALGVNLSMTPDMIARAIDETGIGFMFAPNHHAAMKYAKTVRAELGIRTIFNILGPLTNPSSASNILMGVFSGELVGTQIRVLKALGMKRALVVWGEDNLDEISLGAPTMVGELVDGQIREYTITPEEFGLSRCDTANFRVDNAQASRAVVMDIFNGHMGPAADIVALNAGAALYVAGKVPSIGKGLEKALDAIRTGEAKRRLEAFVNFSRQSVTK